MNTIPTEDLPPWELATQRNVMNMIIVINEKEVSFTERDGGIFTDSLAISEVFDKKHKHVLEKIENKMHLFNKPNFRLDRYIDKKGESRPKFLLDRDFFSFIVMGFTGEKSDQWKLNYIKAFNLMEEKIREGSNPKIQLTDMEIMSKAITLSNNIISELENKITEDKPYIDYAKTIADNDGDMYMRDWIKLLHGESGLPSDVGEQMVINLLIEGNILFRRREGNLAVKSEWVKNTCFNVSRGINPSAPEGKGVYSMNKITAKGRDRFSPRIIAFFNEASKEDREKYKNKKR